MDKMVCRHIDSMSDTALFFLLNGSLDRQHWSFKKRGWPNMQLDSESNQSVKQQCDEAVSEAALRCKTHM